MTIHRTKTTSSIRMFARTLVAAFVMVLTVGSGSAPASAVPDLPAFPGAEGFGAGATGGRGGDIVIVDTLEPFGPGSLGDALAPEDCRPRVVVFRVSGVIVVPGQHDLELTCGNVTIAGQTAPGAGITLSGRIDGYSADPGGNIIIRHLRIRPPPISNEEGAVNDLGQRYDALQLSNNPNLMLDHLSLSWGSDETLDLYEFANDSTIQWTTIEQSNPEGQPEGPHNDAMIAGPDSPRVSVHHVLMAHHEARCPAMATGPAELINSVVYDCQDAFVHHNPAEGEFHIAGNTFVQGPSHDEFTPLFFDDEEPGGTTYWLSQNQFVAPGQFEGIADDIADTPLAEAAFFGANPDQVISEPSDFTQAAETYQPVSMQVPGDAYEAVLSAAGAFPRDAMTLETVDDVRNGTGDWQPNPPDDLLAGLSPTEPPVDDDADGMADGWEADHGLDPANGDDHATPMPSGYTAIEEYVNELSDVLVGQPRPEDAPTTAPPTQAEPEPQTSDPPIQAEPEATDGSTAAAPQSSEPSSDNDGGNDNDRDGIRTKSDGDSSSVLAVTALVVSCIALAIALCALSAARRRNHGNR